MAGAGRIPSHGAPLYIYGPFRRIATPLEPSNAAFYEALRGRDPRCGVGNLDAVAACAAAHGRSLDQANDLPANNLSNIFHRHQRAARMILADTAWRAALVARVTSLSSLA